MPKKKPISESETYWSNFWEDYYRLLYADNCKKYWHTFNQARNEWTPQTWAEVLRAIGKSDSEMRPPPPGKKVGRDRNDWATCAKCGTNFLISPEASNYSDLLCLECGNPESPLEMGWRIGKPGKMDDVKP